MYIHRADSGLKEKEAIKAFAGAVEEKAKEFHLNIKKTKCLLI